MSRSHRELSFSSIEANIESKLPEEGSLPVQGMLDQWTDI